MEYRKVMVLIIDANNLAGKLKILKENDFDLKLLEMIKIFNQNKQRRIILVFDGRDRIGDKIADTRYITRVYSHNDKNSRSADDRIMEIIDNWGYDYSEFNFEGEEVTVISDDQEIIAFVKDRARSNRRLYVMGATEFADRLISEKKDEYYEDGKRGMEDEEIYKINEELRKIWG